MKVFRYILIFCFVVFSQNTFATPEQEKQRDLQIKACFSQAKTCKAQCQGQSKKYDEEEEHFLGNKKTSPRQRCEEACGEDDCWNGADLIRKTKPFFNN